MRFRVTVTALLLVGALLLVTPAASAASNAVAAQYGDDAAVLDETSLPFTGLATTPLLILSLALVAGGLVLRRRSRGTFRG